MRTIVRRWTKALDRLLTKPDQLAKGARETKGKSQEYRGEIARLMWRCPDQIGGRVAKADAGSVNAF
jgi:hypothetical protein